MLNDEIRNLRRTFPRCFFVVSHFIKLCTEVLSRCLQRELTPNQSTAANDSRHTMKTALTTVCNSQRFLKKKKLDNSNVKVSIKSVMERERIVGEIVKMFWIPVSIPPRHCRSRKKCVFALDKQERDMRQPARQHAFFS